MYKVKNVEIERRLRTLAMLIDGGVPKDWGWGLFLVPFGEHEPAAEAGPQSAGTGKAMLAAQAPQGAVFWISNSERSGMVEAIKGWIEEHEQAKKEQTPT